MKLLPLFLLILLSCGISETSIQGKWHRSYIERSENGTITKLDGFNGEQDIIVFNADSAEFYPPVENIVMRVVYSLNDDTLCFNHGATIFTISISNDTLRLNPVKPSSKYTQIYYRE